MRDASFDEDSYVGFYEGKISTIFPFDGTLVLTLILSINFNIWFPDNSSFNDKTHLPHMSEPGLTRVLRRWSYS